MKTKISNGVNKKWLGGLIIFFLMPILLTACSFQKKNEEQNMLLESNPNHRAVLVVAFQGFQDFEYQATKEALENLNIKTTTISSKIGEAIGKFGQSINIEKTFSDIEVERFGAVVFIGGPGSADYIEDDSAHQLARQAIEKDKVLGAICLAPAILARAGVLQNKKATVWSSPLDKETIDILKKGQAEYIDQPVVVDGKIITANGPMAAENFGKKIGELLLK